MGRLEGKIVVVFVSGKGGHLMTRGPTGRGRPTAGDNESVALARRIAAGETGPGMGGMIPRMRTVRADARKRVVIHDAEPGDVFDIQQPSGERYLLVRLNRPAATPRKSREACSKAMSETPLRMTLSWEELRRITREP